MLGLLNEMGFSLTFCPGCPRTEILRSPPLQGRITTLNYPELLTSPPLISLAPHSGSMVIFLQYMRKPNSERQSSLPKATQLRLGRAWFARG